jgi:chemotaxis protein methyltransferase CheR
VDRIEREGVELDLLLEALYRVYGYDFRSYSRTSIERRVKRLLVDRKEGSLSELIPGIIQDETLAGVIIRSFSISVTEMFRDPLVYLSIRESVIPMLRTYPFIKIWHAGCATGEEVYSMAILLAEEGLLERANIYATDFNDELLEQARKGIYPARSFQDATRNYQRSGGHKSFSDYYSAKYESVAIDAALKDKITFSSHNLVTDGVFGEMHMVFCRNVLIYFNRELKERVLGLFEDSLVRGGFLCLGSKESVRFASSEKRFVCVDEACRLLRKRRDFAVTL